MHLHVPGELVLPRLVWRARPRPYHLTSRTMLEHMCDAAEELVNAAGGEIVDYQRGRIDRAGSAIHEHGTGRTGEDPKRSALNAFNRRHEVNTLFVVDGSVFPTATEKNPTLTALALSSRATDFIVEEMKRGDLG